MTDTPRLTALVYGASGAGKSWLGATTPVPRLIIDLEGRARYTPDGEQATQWNGIDPLLNADGTSAIPRSPTRTVIVTVTEVKTLDSVYQWLRSGKHPFVSVTLDSLMFAQMRTRSDISSGSADFRTQDWGTLLWKIERLVTQFHDLTLLPVTKVRSVVFLAGSTMKDGFLVPMMQGQIGSKLPYLVDMAGYLQATRTEAGELVRQLIVEPYPAHGIRDVKDGTHKVSATFGGIIQDPNFTRMYEALRSQEEKG